MQATRTSVFDPAVNRARQSLYRFAALSLLDPRRGAWRELQSLRDERLVREAAALLRAVPESLPQRLNPGELPAPSLDPKAVLDRLPDSSPALNAQYENTFGLLVSCRCPPYEIEYVPSKFDFQRSNGLADISGFYQAFGLRVAQAHPERPDHIVLELEFMAFLIGLERRAAEAHGPQGADRRRICREAETRFLTDHLAWWSPAFARLLVRENNDGFYAAAGQFLAALIPIERAQLGVEVPSRTAAPSVPERPEACEGCQLAN